VRTSHGVDSFVANSQFIARRIWKTYRRHARVIYPPVDTGAFSVSDRREEFYLTASRLVPYKKIEVLVEAFASMPNKRLVVIGDGPGWKGWRARATPNVTLLGYQSTDALRDFMQRARAFLFASREDFGIVLVEAQAAGTPVIAFGQGGALETIRGLGAEKPTGLFFDEQTPAAVIEAVRTFEQNHNRIQAADCRENALRFSVERFHQDFYEHAISQWDAFRSQTFRPRIQSQATPDSHDMRPPYKPLRAA